MFVCNWHQSEWFIVGLTCSTATILQYTNVTGPNQSSSCWDRPPTPFGLLGIRCICAPSPQNLNVYLHHCCDNDDAMCRRLVVICSMRFCLQNDDRRMVGASTSHPAVNIYCPAKLKGSRGLVEEGKGESN